MPYQTQSDIEVAYKSEGSSFGVLPGGTGAKILRLTGGALAGTKRSFQSAEVRGDAQVTRGRHTIRGAGGGYPTELSIGTFDDLFAAVFRGAWSAPLTFNQASGVSLAASAAGGTFSLGGSSWQALGIRVGDVWRPGGLSAPSNQKNYMTLGISGAVATVYPPPAVDMAADTSFDVTRPKRLLNPAKGSLIRQSFTFEERENSIDASELFWGVRVSRFALRMAPGGAVTVEWGLQPKDWEPRIGAQSPYFTDPVATVTLPLSTSEAKLVTGTTPVLDLTALEIVVDLAAAGVDTIASTSTPDIFEGPFRPTGSFTALRQDITRVLDFHNETQFAVHLMCEENEPGPADFISFFLGNQTFSGATKSAIAQGGGPRTQTLPLQIGKDEGRTGYDDTTMKIVTSAA